MPFVNIRRMGSGRPGYHGSMGFAGEAAPVLLPPTGGTPMLPRKPIGRVILPPVKLPGRPGTGTAPVSTDAPETLPGPKIATTPTPILLPPKVTLPGKGATLTPTGGAPGGGGGGGGPQPPPQPQGGMVFYQGGTSCTSGYKTPGISSTGCSCVPIDDQNSFEARMSRLLESVLASSNPVGTLNYYNYYSSTNQDYADFLQHWHKGVAAYEYAKSFGLCWPIPGETWLNDGGTYVLGGSRAAAAILGVPMLYDMAIEIGSQQYTGTALWPTAVPQAEGLNHPSAYGLHGLLRTANNIIANYLTIARAYEAGAARARDSANICLSRLQSGAGSEPLLVSGLGDMVYPDANTYMLYYLLRYPAIQAMIPSNAASFGASEIANAINKGLESLVSYARQLREEQRLLVEALTSCERGIVQNLPGSGYQPGFLPDIPPLDPSAGPSSLPDPYAEHGVLPGTDVAPGSDSDINIVSDESTASTTSKASAIALLALVGVAFLKGR